MRTFIQKYKLPLATFILPVAIMGIIYLFLGVYPFGDESLMTIDLGQQYIDFFAEYKQTLLENPRRLFYSFTKGIGGEMTGIWAYYLMSPFNLIFLFFPNHLLDVAVTLIILLKYGLIGWSMGFYLRRTFQDDHPRLLLFTTSYALMGYLVVYQFNLMWTDGLFFLPLVCYGIEKFFRTGRGLTYSLLLAATLLTNYYIGYMICLFLIFYFFYRGLYYCAFDTYRNRARSLGKFIGHSVLGAGVASFLLIPTFLQLTQSKGNYTPDAMDWSLDYAVPEILSKFFLGAFNFDQMPSGLPNVFIGSLMVIGSILYFFNRYISRNEKIFAFAFITFMLFSMNSDLLNKVWHGFQDPNWFPYRFSFIFSFFLILMAYRGTRHRTQIDFKDVTLGVIAIGFVSVYVSMQDFDFLENSQIILTFLFYVVFLLTIAMKPYFKKYSYMILIAIVLLEMGLNAGITISRLGYVDHSNFTYAQQIINQSVTTIQAQDDSFYRIEKTFQRTKNDSHQVNYQGVAHFGSTLESHIHDLFSNLGLPASNGYVVYTNGTVLTDALFGIKYFITDKETNNYVNETQSDYYQNIVLNKSQKKLMIPDYLTHSLVEKPENFNLSSIYMKPDLYNYPKIGKVNEDIAVHLNPYALPLGFTVQESMGDIHLNKYAPLTLQNVIFRNLTSEARSKKLFEQQPVTFYTQNLDIVSNSGKRMAYQKDKNEPAQINFTITPNGLDSYYLLFNGDNDWEDINMTVNGKPVNQYDTYYDDIVLNLASQGNSDELSVSIEVLSNEFNMTDMHLHQMDLSLFRDVILKVQDKGIQNVKEADNRLIFTAEVAENEQLLLTLPYDPSWKITANGKQVTSEPILESLISIDLPPGSYEVEMVYETPYFKTSIAISVISLALLVTQNTYQKRRKKTNKFIKYP